MSDTVPPNRLLIYIPLGGVSDTLLIDHGALLGVSNVIHWIPIVPLEA